ncbi:T-cell leukemia translocation-altered gene protein isoform 1-T1 [Chlamydotis macqueenii]
MSAVSGAWQAPWRALGALGRELAAEWAAQDVRAALCQLLLLWLGLSLLGVRLAWRAYGGAVAALCYRTGPAARRAPAPATGTGSGLSPGPARPRAHSLSPAGPAGRNGAAERPCPPRPVQPREHPPQLHLQTSKPQ